MKKETHLIEGINADGSGGRSYEGNFSVEEITDKINELLNTYNKVILCRNYPHGDNENFTTEVSVEEIKLTKK